MPVPLWLKLKTDQFLDAATFVTQIKYPKTFTFFLALLFSVLLYYFRKRIQNLTRLYRSIFYITILYSSLAVHI